MSAEFGGQYICINFPIIDNDVSTLIIPNFVVRHRADLPTVASRQAI